MTKKLLILFTSLFLLTGCSKSANFANLPGLGNLTDLIPDSDNLITRSCIAQPLNSTGGIETSINGTAWSSCQNFTCDYGYIENNGTCQIDQFILTITKLINQGTITDLTFGLINSAINETLNTELFDYNQVIILEATPTVGYIITGWSGCDSVSLNNKRCTVSLTSDKTVTPIFEPQTMFEEKIIPNYEGLTILSKRGRVYNIGSNTSGVYGVGDTISRNYITPLNFNGVINNKKIIDISSSETTTCAITTDGLGYCWGDNSHYSLGDGTVISSLTPIPIKMNGALNNKYLKKIFTGTHRACAIASDERAYCWGYPSSGTLAGTYQEPTKIDDLGALSGKDITDIYIGDNADCFLTNDSGLYCLGDRGAGILGQSTTAFTATPLSIDMSGVLSGKSILKASVYQNQGGRDFVCAIASDNLPYCWGYNGDGQLGNNSTTNSLVPVSVDTSGALAGKTIKDISVGYGFACVITNDDSIVCWGDNTTYQVSEAAIGKYLVPIEKTKTGLLLNKQFTKIHANADHACVETVDAELICWGNAVTIGDGLSASPRYKYPEISLIKSFENHKISIQVDNACAINDQKDLYCWGFNGQGAIGNGTYIDSALPIQINNSGLINTKKFKKVSVGGDHSCAIDTDGIAYCWGGNTYGQLGNGNNTSSNTPVLVDFSSFPNFNQVEEISSGNYYTCAIIHYNNYSSKKFVCWGLNDNGQIGDFSTTNKNSPVMVYESGVFSVGYNPLQIVTAENTTCSIAQLSNNEYTKAFCWGRNNTADGFLGINNSASNFRHNPQEVYNSGVLANKSIKQISGSSSRGSFCVITSDNETYCWGSGGDGELGDGGWVSSIIPISPNFAGVLSGKKIINISSGRSQFCGLTNDNLISCWGRGDYGQLGNGLIASSNVPVLSDMTALGDKTVLEIISGHTNSCALTTNNQVYCWGWNYAGQFGINNYTQSNVPVRAIDSLTFDF